MVERKNQSLCIRPAPNTCCPERNDNTINEFGYCSGCNKIYNAELFKAKSLLLFHLFFEIKYFTNRDRVAKDKYFYINDRFEQFTKTEVMK